MENLTNKKRGQDATLYGKTEVSRLEARYSPDELLEEDIDDNIMLIKINQLYRNDMSATELYDAVRGFWRVDPEHARKADYALAVYKGMVLEVYRIVDWYPAHTTLMERPHIDPNHFIDTYTHNDPELSERYEFVGRIADEQTRGKYINRSVAGLYKKNEQTSVRYMFGKNMKNTD